MSKSQLTRFVENITKPNKEIEEEVRKQLAPLFAVFFADSPRFEIYKRHIPQFIERIKKPKVLLTTLAETMNICASAKEKPSYPKVIAFIAAVTYLAFAEIFVDMFIDQLILLLIAGGQDLHLEPDYEHRYTRHVTSLEDLDSPALSLSIKLDFLEVNGVPFLSKWIDRPLRNKIAHLDFEIDDNGGFFIFEEKGRKKVDLQRKLQTLTEYHNAFTRFFLEQVTKKTGQKF